MIRSTQQRSFMTNYKSKVFEKPKMFSGRDGTSMQSSVYDGESSVVSNAKLQEQIFKAKQKWEKGKRQEMKVWKQEAEREAIDFVKRSSIDICKSLTKQHHALIKQFRDFRDFTWIQLDAMRNCVH